MLPGQHIDPGAPASFPTAHRLHSRHCGSTLCPSHASLQQHKNRVTAVVELGRKLRGPLRPRASPGAHTGPRAPWAQAARGTHDGTLAVVTRGTCQHVCMSSTDPDVSGLRDDLPASVATSLTDDQLHAGLHEARKRLGPDAETTAVHGAAWLLAHGHDRRREQIDHMLQIMLMRREHLLQVERHLLGAFQADPDLDDSARDITSIENLNDLDRAEALLGVLTARAGGTATVTGQEITIAPPFSIELAGDGLRVTAYNLDDEEDSKDQ